MIYTSYFAKLRSLPENIVPVSICGKTPDWYTGLQYKKLAPKYDFFIKWKQNHDNDYYIKCFKEQVLDKLSYISVVNHLQLILPYNMRVDMDSDVAINTKYHVALICYEKPTDFCHRHLVANWLNQNGIRCEEWIE